MTRTCLVFAFLPACFVHVSAMTEGPDGETLIAARRQVFGIPAKMHILSCEHDGSGLDCTRMLSGPDLQRQIRQARWDPNESEMASLMTDVYRTLGRPSPDAEAALADEKAVRAALREGMDGPWLLKGLQKEIAVTPDASLTELLQRVVDKLDL